MKKCHDDHDGDDHGTENLLLFWHGLSSNFEFFFTDVLGCFFFTHFLYCFWIFLYARFRLLDPDRYILKTIYKLRCGVWEGGASLNLQVNFMEKLILEFGGVEKKLEKFILDFGGR